MDATPLAFVVAVHVSTTTLLGFFSWNVIDAFAMGLPPIESLSLSVSVAVILAGSLYCTVVSPPTTSLVFRRITAVVAVFVSPE